MKFLCLVLVSAFIQLVPVGALSNVVDVSGGDMTVTDTKEIANIPDVTGMSEQDAMQTLENILLPDGSRIEIIKKYEYSSEVEKDKVYEQIPVGETAIEDAKQVKLSISLGQEPNELLSEVSEEADRLSTFGIAAYKNSTPTPTTSMLGIDWDSIPASYEYNWDNSMNCWQWGVWVNGECYKSEWGTYNTDVRHKMQLYCDGTYVYLHIVMSRDYYDQIAGDDFRFVIDGQEAAFQLKFMDGKKVTGHTKDLAPGTYQVDVVHRDNHISSGTAPDSLAYITKHESEFNGEVELKIPLSELARQNPRIDLDNIGMIQFYTPNLMYRKIMASGASTFPLASAGMALLLIPGSSILLNKKYKKSKKSEGMNE